MDLSHALCLETDRLSLRSHQSSDWDSVHVYAGDPEFSKFELWGPNTIDETQTYVREMVAQSFAIPRYRFEFAICLKTSGRLIGGAGLRREAELSQVANLGWAITPEFQGQGFATEVGRALIRFGFECLELSLIYATCDARNTASFRVMEKIGMNRVGLLKATHETKGHIRDTLRYEIE